LALLISFRTGEPTVQLDLLLKAARVRIECWPAVVADGRC
jgi:hypothetical protein